MEWLPLASGILIKHNQMKQQVRMIISARLEAHVKIGKSFVDRRFSSDEDIVHPS